MTRTTPEKQASKWGISITDQLASEMVVAQKSGTAIESQKQNFMLLSQSNQRRGICLDSYFPSLLQSPDLFAAHRRYPIVYLRHFPFLLHFDTSTPNSVLFLGVHSRYIPLISQFYRQVWCRISRNVAVTSGTCLMYPMALLSPSAILTSHSCFLVRRGEGQSTDDTKHHGQLGKHHG